MDMSTLISTFMGKAQSVSEHEDDAVYQKAMVYEMVNSMNSLETQENDLKAFKEYIEAQRADENSKLHSALSGVQYTYDIDLLIYTRNVDGSIIRSDRQTLMTEIMKKYAGADISSVLALRERTVMGGSSSIIESSMALWKELLPGDNGKPVNSVIEKQYDIIYGRWPANYNEIVLFVDENNEIDDLTLFALGLKSEKEIGALMEAALNKTTVDYEIQKWSYEEICNMEFRTILSSDCYTFDEKTGTYIDLRESEAGLKYLYDNALALHVVGIAKPSENAISLPSNASIGYTHKLTEYIIEKASESDAVKAQLADPATDIFTGLPFKDSSGKLTSEKKAADFRGYVSSLDTAGKAEIYVKIMSIPPEDAVKEFISGTLASMTRADMEKMIAPALVEQTGMAEETVAGYISSMSDEDLSAMLSQALEEQYKAQYAAGVEKQMSAMTDEQLSAALDMAMEQLQKNNVLLIMMKY